VHPLYKLMEETEATHSGLGNAIAFAAICSKAKLCLLVVSPAGCGKSAISDGIAHAHPQSVKLDSVTRSGLSNFKDQFTHFTGLVVIDDLGKVDTNYSRIHTVTSFAELCYSHFIAKYTMTVTVEIFEFHGSAVLNVQPPVLAALVESDEWEVVTADKTVRYYHLYRPVKPNENKLEPSIDWGIDFDLIHKPRHSYRQYDKLAKIASIQWSDARVLQHLDSLLKASAALARRQDVNVDDYNLLARLMKPMTVERHITSKSGFEVGRRLDTNLLAVLVEFASWKDINIERICRDYKVSPSTAYRLLAQIGEWFDKSSPESKKLIPKMALKRVLKEAGVIRG